MTKYIHMQYTISAESRLQDFILTSAVLTSDQMAEIPGLKPCGMYRTWKHARDGGSFRTAWVTAQHFLSAVIYCIQSVISILILFQWTEGHYATEKTINHSTNRTLCVLFDLLAQICDAKLCVEYTCAKMGGGKGGGGG